MTPKEVRTQWAAALRSGVYQQGRGLLRDGERFCCLGVLCELAIQSGEVQLARGIDSTGTHVYVDNGIKYDVVLPPNIQAWAGLTTNMGAYRHPNKENAVTLMHNNDTRCTFDQIAAIIDAEPVGLCT